MDPQERRTPLGLPTGVDVRNSFAASAFDARQVRNSFATAAFDARQGLGRPAAIRGHRHRHAGQAPSGGWTCTWDGIIEFLKSSISQRDTAWRYLLDLVDPFTGMTVALSLEAKDRYDPSFEDAAAQVIERAFGEPQLKLDIRAAIEASTLPVAHRTQLITGLAFVETQDHELAVPLLIIALEGAFWRLASDRRVIERNCRGHWITTQEINGRKSQIRGLDSLVKLPGLDLDPDLVRFLTILTYGGAGNDFRHGTATDRWQLRSTFLTAALLGWLETTGSLDARNALRAAACRKHSDRRQSSADGDQTA